MRIRVLLVDDHELIRQGLRRAFERSDDFEVVGDVGTATEALHSAAALEPQVVVLDVRLPDGSGLDVAAALRARDPQLAIVILTMYGGDDHLFDALEAGASAFVAKDAPVEDVLTAARHALRAPTSFSAADLGQAVTRRLKPQGPQLTEREQDVLRLLALGHPTATISKQLFISESTTKTHLSRIYEKLGANNRAQALMAAMRLGLVESQSS